MPRISTTRPGSCSASVGPRWRFTIGAGRAALGILILCQAPDRQAQDGLWLALTSHALEVRNPDLAVQVSELCQSDKHTLNTRYSVTGNGS